MRFEGRLMMRLMTTALVALCLTLFGFAANAQSRSDAHAEKEIAALM